LHTNSFDEALSLPTEESALLALRTQQILAHETGVTQTVDPLAGSYFLEELCGDLEQKSMQLIRRIDEMGGMLKAIETGYVQREIQNSAFQAQKAIDSRTQIVVGVNSFEMQEKPPKNLHSLNKSVVKEQLLRLKTFKSKRKRSDVDRALRALELQARRLHQDEPAEVCESILAAVEAKVTLGEIADVFRAVAGTYSS